MLKTVFRKVVVVNYFIVGFVICFGVLAVADRII